MSHAEFSLIVCAAFTMALIAYPNLAVNAGWLTGSFFVLPATNVTILGGAIALALVVHVFTGMASGGFSIWWLLIFPSAALGGGTLITILFGRHTGAVALLGSPVSYLTANYFYFFS